MTRLVAFIRKANSLFSFVILSFFYLFILPLGKIIFLTNSLFLKEKPNTYWQEPDAHKLDLTSSY